MKKLLSLILVLLLLTACGKNLEDVSSIVNAESESLVANESTTQSQSATLSNSFIVNAESESLVANESTTQSQSATLSNTFLETSSQTESEGVKVFKNNNCVSLGAYHLSMVFCDFYGDDFESRKKEFTEVVNSGYFNTYFLPLDTYLMTELEIIAKAGGSAFISAGIIDTNQIESYVNRIKIYIDTANKMGYGDIIEGFYWDEPVSLFDMKNEALYEYTKALYKAFGKRIYPIMASGDFLLEDAHSYTFEEADAINKQHPKALSYATDIGFDYYWCDARSEDGKEYFSHTRQILLNYIGHDANFWHWPCAYTTELSNSVDGITKANEEYCLEHLNFLASDILSLEYPGGIVLYTYYGKAHDNRYNTMQHFLEFKDKNGNYTIMPTAQKWKKYSQRLLELNNLFSSKKAKKPTFNFN
ncbi:MAG: hypothetical protein IJO86_04900 [Oscillospiraceae bacterium]|nr:hypothetical protein [Oscillospiraceae bacterium]